MISFIIPAYNEEKFIEKTLKSIPDNFEKIVVCNGCKDNTYQISKRYAKKVYNLSKKNVSLARNFGAKKAKNELLVFLDADTQLTKEAINDLLKIKDDLVGTFKVKFNKNNLSSFLFCKLKNLILLFKIHNASGVIFCSKDVFNKTKGFNENLIKRENGEFVNKAKKYAPFYYSRHYSITSSRRYDKIGYLKTCLYWLKETLFPGRDYPAIR